MPHSDQRSFRQPGHTDKHTYQTDNSVNNLGGPEQTIDCTVPIKVQFGAFPPSLTSFGHVASRSGDLLQKLKPALY